MNTEKWKLLFALLCCGFLMVSCSQAAGTPTATQAPIQPPTETQAPPTPIPPTETPPPTPPPTLTPPRAPDTAFERTYGGGGLDRGVFVTQTQDGGYAVVGVTSSFGEGGEDVYLIRTDPNGEERWSQTYGGPGSDNGWSVLETTEGGFLIAGFTSSFGAGGQDIYLVRTDATGELLWSQTYGGAGDDYGWALQAAAEGGYIIAGQTNSSGAGDIDAYLVRVDEAGEIIWSQTYGGTGEDRTFSVRQTSEGGFIIVGTTTSLGGGGRDAYVVKTDSQGLLQWEHAFGDVGDDVAHSVDETLDGGTLVMGYTNSFGARNYDAYLIKLNSEGETEWTQMFGEPSEDRVITGEQTADGGFILVGFSRSFGTGAFDAYLVKTDANGLPVWTKSFGGNGEDTGYTVQQTTDGGYILTGYTPQAAGSRDVYLIKLLPE